MVASEPFKEGRVQDHRSGSGFQMWQWSFSGPEHGHVDTPDFPLGCRALQACVLRENPDPRHGTGVCAISMGDKNLTGIKVLS